MNIYKEHGYLTRQDYLEDLAIEYDVDILTMLSLAELYGPSEDFDGLVTALEDME